MGHAKFLFLASILACLWNEDKQAAIDKARAAFEELCTIREPAVAL